MIRPYDKTHPRSMYSLSPDFIQRQMNKLEVEEWGLREEEFIEQFGEVDFMTNRVRLEFWREYDLCQSQMRRIEGANISSRCGLPLSQIEDIFSRRDRLMWILIPPGTYESFLDEALQFGLSRLRKDLLSIPLYRKRMLRDGSEVDELDSKAADLLLKTVAFLDMRKNGGIVQKNLHIMERAKDFKEVATPEKELLAIEERIRELELKGDMSRVLGDMDKMSKDAVVVGEDTYDEYGTRVEATPVITKHKPQFEPEVVLRGGKVLKRDRGGNE